jgi:hypothetical protein
MLSRHEHLYGRIKENIIVSDGLHQLARIQKALQGTQVILCTLSMVSNPKLAPVTALVPIVNVIIDEASQIEVGQYVPLFNTFGESLRKICFVGDDKQCKSLQHYRIARNSTFCSAASRTRRSTELTINFRSRALEEESRVPRYTMCIYRISTHRARLVNLALFRSNAPTNRRVYIATRIRWPASIRRKSCCPIEYHRLPIHRREWDRTTRQRREKHICKCST